MRALVSGICMVALRAIVATRGFAPGLTGDHLSNTSALRRL